VKNEEKRAKNDTYYIGQKIEEKKRPKNSLKKR
jgi:hypothetical protein